MIQAILTIDDIPSQVTPAIVDYLNAKGIPAILFAVGRDVDRHPDQAIYALRRGMIVGNHSYTHPRFSELSLEAAIEEVERCEQALDHLYQAAGVPRTARPFRFPNGDKGGAIKDALQRYLSEKGFDKVRDTQIPYPWWKETGLDRDIDTFWTFNFMEYRIRPQSGFTMDDVWKRMRDPAPASGAPLFGEDGRHILLLHAHDETEAMVPGYWRQLIDGLLENGVTFVKPAFMRL